MIAAGRSDQAAPVLDLHVLGAFTVLHNGKPLALPPSRKTRARWSIWQSSINHSDVTGYAECSERSHDLRGAHDGPSKIRKIVNIDGKICWSLAQRSCAASNRLPSICGIRDCRSVCLGRHCQVEALALKGGFLEDLSPCAVAIFESWRLCWPMRSICSSRNAANPGRSACGRPSRALLHAHALQSTDPANSAWPPVALANRRANWQSRRRRRTAGMRRDLMPMTPAQRANLRSSTARVKTSRCCRSRSWSSMAWRPWLQTWCFRH